jgi:hypothetical protein
MIDEIRLGAEEIAKLRGVRKLSPLATTTEPRFRNHTMDSPCATLGMFVAGELLVVVRQRGDSYKWSAVLDVCIYHRTTLERCAQLFDVPGASIDRALLEENLLVCWGTHFASVIELTGLSAPVLRYHGDVWHGHGLGGYGEGNLFARPGFVAVEHGEVELAHGLCEALSASAAWRSVCGRNASSTELVVLDSGSRKEAFRDFGLYRYDRGRFIRVGAGTCPELAGGRNVRYALRGGLLAADDMAQTAIFDVADPRAPTLLGIAKAKVQARHLAWASDDLLLRYGVDYVQPIAMTNPRKPDVGKGAKMSGEFRSLSRTGDYLVCSGKGASYLTDTIDIVRVNGVTLTREASATLGRDYQLMAYADGLMTLACEDGSLVVYRLDGPASK